MGECIGRKSIFITGAASGIGKATAKLFADRSWFVGLYDVNEEGLAEVAKEIGEENCISSKLDVRNRDDWKTAIDAFGKATDGRMTVLFNNAGVGRHGWFEEMSGEDNDWVVDVNVKGIINGVQAALPLLRATPGSRIVNTASTAGVVGSPKLAVYSATKFAVRGLTEALDVEFSNLGIRVTSLMPWFIDTPILDMGKAEGSNEKMSDQIRDAGQDVYPVEIAAERAWDAAHGKETHYMAGKMAERTRFAARFMPNRLKKMLVKNLGPRE
ncbi:SDR family oxidoreductase [Henriciella aquimarina]|uniref:SDR family oxidoreductase n=1 Tax=Henriciella aquimarina TaxID=545261 RepID=UPI0009FFB9DF|nr:SDR family oxidoreductase [Henriciella aquimarina]